MKEKTNQFPSEEVTLPSKGLLYSKDSPLSKGVIEMKYMTAREEDILTNQNLIENGTVIDKLLQSLILSPIDYNDLLLGDKNAVLIATRILGYGAEYKVSVKGEEHQIDLGKLENKPFDESNLVDGKNEFNFTLPHSKTVLTYKILTGNDESAIERELAGLKRLNKNNNPEMTTRLKYMILAVDGNVDKKTIREFVDNGFLARDARAFRNNLKTTSPDVDLSYLLDNGEEVEVAISLGFFWPDLGDSFKN